MNNVFASLSLSQSLDDRKKLILNLNLNGIFNIKTKSIVLFKLY